MIGVSGTMTLTDHNWYHGFATLLSALFKTPHEYLQKKAKAIKQRSTLNTWLVFQFAILHC